jgi:mono/diheme cytochrome c family protein
MKSVAILLLLPSLALAEGADPLVVNNCLQCHTEELLAQQRLTAKQWAAVVKKMVGWGAPVEAENVEALVKLLSSHYSLEQPALVPPAIDPKAAQAALEPLPDGPYAKGNAKKGKLLYAQACASCHGADGHGSPSGMNLADRPLLGRAAEFVQPVRAGRGRMPAFSTLTRGDLAALLAYVRTL